MSNCLTHYNDQHIQIRKDLFDLCAYDKTDFNNGLSKNGKKVMDEPNQACMAMILRLLETLTNRNNEPWVTLSYSAIAALLYHTYSEGTIRKSIAALLAKGYIQCQQETKGSIPSYALNIPAIQSGLDQQRKEYIQKGVNVDRGAVKFDSGGVNVDSLGVSNLAPYKKEDKITHKITYERKNGASQQKPNVSTQQEATHPSIHSKKKDDKISSLSPEKPKEKVVLNEEEKRIYDLVCPHLFEEDPPEVTPAMKGHCAKIAKRVKDEMQLISLIDFTRKEQHLEKKTVYFGNLARGLNGWLQTQKSIETPTTSSPPKQTTNLLELYQMIHSERNAS